MTASGRTDVDARFLLANERTLLAWIRTALTLLAVGAGVVEFGEQFAGRQAVAALLLGTGTASAVTGAVRYARADRALRAGDLPQTGRAPFLLAASVCVVGAALLLALFAR